MSGTDPNGKWFGKPGDPTSPFRPDGSGQGSGSGETLPNDLPKLPGITLQYEIARGGMGVVYSGRQDFLDRRVAVKFLSVELGGEAFAKRFQREAKILAGISHPNIVGCHMADTTPQGQSYLVMEFIDGPSLKAWVSENGPVSPLASLRLVRASAAALAHAHLSDIIHRDVKPENILLESVTSTAIDITFPFSPKLVDLGLARMTHEQVGMGLTSPGSVMGTPSTMSPEQFDDPDSVDFRSDIYGLGCCLYEMLVGHPAFRGSKLTDIVLRKREPVAPNPCDENPAIPAAVGAFTQRMLASRREDRPASYKELDQEIGELMQALQSANARTDTVVGGKLEDLDRTVASRPGAFGGGGDATRVAPEATQPAPGKTAPGMLNTGELNFLSEGVPPADPTAPAFRENATAAVSFGANETAQGSGTQATAASMAGAGGSRKGVMILVVVLALVAAGVGVAFATGGDKPAGGGAQNTGTQNGGGDVVAPTPGANSLPVVSIASAPTEVDVGKRFSIALAAADGDGDELEYSWEWPADVVHAMSQTNGAKVEFLLDDGLPGVELAITASVSDGRAAEPVRVAHKITVGACPRDLPLAAYKAKGWTEVGSWTQLTHPTEVNPGVASRSKGGIATLARPVGSEPYWEWSGTLQPSKENGDGVGLLEVDLGDRAFAVRAMLADATREWSIELLERPAADQDWRPAGDDSSFRWREPEDTIDTYAGWLSIRRDRDRLTFAVAESVRAPSPINGDATVAKIGEQKTFVADLTPEQAKALSDGGQVRLVNPRGRCIFKLELR